MTQRVCQECGAPFLFRDSPSREGRGKYCSRSCGTAFRTRVHGHAANYTTSPTYNTWLGMVKRCTCPTASNYERYGGRGITVCDEWKDSFPQFLADMGEKPPGTSIERDDNDGPYCKANCSWQTAAKQQRNRRNNVFLEFRGETLCMSDWAARIGIAPDVLAWRVRHGWGERAFTTPASKSNRVVPHASPRAQ